MRTSLRVNALGRKQIFHAKRNTFKRTGFAFSDTRIGSLCHFARLFRRHSDIGIELVIGGINSRNIGICEFSRGKCLGLQLVARFGNGQCGQFAHRQIL
ncbi:hypothetical protein D9M68_891180 [compost metagenome]